MGKLEGSAAHGLRPRDVGLRRTRHGVPSRAQAASELRVLSDHGDWRHDDLSAPLRRAVIAHWGDTDTARRALRLPPARRGPRTKWTRDLVVATITALAATGQRITHAALKKSGLNSLANAVRTTFGSWGRLRIEAGLSLSRLPYHRRTWDADDVLTEIGNRRRAGKSIAVTKVPGKLRHAAIRYFGSWRHAVEHAGFDYNAIRMQAKVPNDALLEWLQDLSVAHPMMSLYDLDRHGGHATTCRARWGSFEKAAAAAGIQGWPIRKRGSAMSREMTIAELRRLRGEGVQLKTSTLAKLGLHSLLHAVRRHFAAWRDAVDSVSTRPATRATRAKTHRLTRRPAGR